MSQVHVELTRLHESRRLHFKATFPPREGSWNLQLPTWRPGRYELGNFAQYVMWVEGVDCCVIDPLGRAGVRATQQEVLQSRQGNEQGGDGTPETRAHAEAMLQQVLKAKMLRFPNLKIQKWKMKNETDRARLIQTLFS